MCSRPTSRRRSWRGLGRGARGYVGAADPGGGGGRRGGGRIAGRADVGDLRAARAGDRSQPAIWLVAAGARPGAVARPGRAHGSRTGRAQHRLPAAASPGGRRARAGAGRRTAARDARCAPAGGGHARLLRGYRALAVASGLVVPPTRPTSIAGSPLTSLSLLGPNPGLGVRFYGIGNELEALLGGADVAGSGAGLAGFAPRPPAPRLRWRFLAAGLFAALVFAAGRFGADVGAAIVLPVGRCGRRAAMPPAAPARPAGGRAAARLLALLALADLVSGANAHLTRSVLDAGGLGDLADVAQRRLQLSAHSFARPIVFLFLPLIAALAILRSSSGTASSDWLEPPSNAGRPDRLPRRDLGRHPGQRFRRPAARDRQRLPARLRRLRLGAGESAAESPATPPG